MNIFEPIKSLEKIQEMKQILAKKPRNTLLFSFDINSRLRIADILSLNVKDKDYIELREKKTNKYKNSGLIRTESCSSKRTNLERYCKS